MHEATHAALTRCLEGVACADHVDLEHGLGVGRVVRDAARRVHHDVGPFEGRAQRVRVEHVALVHPALDRVTAEAHHVVLDQGLAQVRSQEAAGSGDDDLHGLASSAAGSSGPSRKAWAKSSIVSRSLVLMTPPTNSWTEGA